MSKRKVRRALLTRLLPPVVYLFLVALRTTLRIRHVNREAVGRLWDGGENIIACFWHGRLLAMPFAYRGNRAKVLISRHTDGELIARVISLFRHRGRPWVGRQGGGLLIVQGDDRAAGRRDQYRHNAGRAEGPEAPCKAGHNRAGQDKRQAHCARDVRRQ